MPFSKYKIISIENSQDVRIYRMEPLDKKMLIFVPGQSVFLHLLDSEGKTIQKRPYSIASSPNSPYLEFAIKMVGGAMTSQLDLLKIGAILGVEGPVGHFTYNEQKNICLIACGTGVAPMLSIVRHVAGKKLTGNFVLIYSTRTTDSILYKNEFNRLNELNQNIKTVITLTREQHPENWDGELGRINRDMILKNVKDPKNNDWWICGSMEFIKTMKFILGEIGVDMKKVNIEGWG
ncbi:MAG: FAD-dependent oxidoreductase [Candidatus Micrarchaeota archaeon]